MSSNAVPASPVRLGKSSVPASPAAASSAGTKKDKMKQPPPTIDALTADLNKRATITDEGASTTAAQGSAAAGTEEDAAVAAIEDKRTLKDRIAQPDAAQEAQLPSLQAWLHDRVWAEGGELVLHIGGKAADEGVYESEEELASALQTIKDAASKVGCEASCLRTGPLPRPAEETGDPTLPAQAQEPTEQAGPRRVSAHVLVRRIPEGAQELMEIRVAVVGNVDAGKSTLLGVLTKGVLDDGRGKARVNLFRHKHEIESGRTSSVGMEIMGYDAGGKPVTGTMPSSKEEPGRKLTWEEVCEKAAKVISFIDLAGHENYLKVSDVKLGSFVSQVLERRNPVSFAHNSLPGCK